MKALMLYSTGTGNSYRVARWTRDMLEERMIPCEVKPLLGARKTGLPAMKPGDLLGVSLPTHGFTAQWSVIKNTFGLPRGNESHAFVTACCAGMKAGKVHLPGLEGSTGWVVAFILCLKGYKIRAVNGVDMPSNWIVVHPGFSRRSAEFMSDRCRKRHALLIDRVLEGRTFFPPRSLVNLVLGIVLIPVSLGYNLVGRFMLSKMLFADERCTSCGLCEKLCPVRGVALRGGKRKRPRWSFRCESCMRCVAFCPEKAIEMNTLWFAGSIWLFASGVPSFVDGFLPRFTGGWSATAAGSARVGLDVLLTLAGSWVPGKFCSGLPACRAWAGFWLSRPFRVSLEDTMNL